MASSWINACVRDFSQNFRFIAKCRTVNDLIQKVAITFKRFIFAIVFNRELVFFEKLISLLFQN